MVLDNIQTSLRRREAGERPVTLLPRQKLLGQTKEEGTPPLLTKQSDTPVEEPAATPAEESTEGS